MRRIRVAHARLDCQAQTTTTFPAQNSLSPRAGGELAAISVLWGASFPAIRVALDEVSLIWIVAHRTVWAALVLWIVLALRGQTLPRDPVMWGVFGIMGLLSNVIPSR